MIGLEPSCLAVWRSDAAELLPEDPRVAEVAAGVLTLAELLERTPNWSPPDLSGIELVVQPHCHHASVIGWQADATLLAATGATRDNRRRVLWSGRQLWSRERPLRGVGQGG